MIKRIAAASVLALCAALPVRAATWNFTYTGFQDWYEGQFHPAWTLQGSFSSSSWGDDGIVDLGELDSLVVDGFSYLDCRSTDGYSCSVFEFGYTLGGGLGFRVTERYDEGYGAGHSTTIHANNYLYRLYTGYLGVPLGDQYMGWTGETTLSVTLVPVPEPSMLAMLAAGGALLTARRRIRA